jgi:hypothetical protein
MTGFYCDFYGNDFKRINTKNAFECNRSCLLEELCTHFVFNPYTVYGCQMKAGIVSKSNAELNRVWSKNDTRKRVCGLFLEKLYNFDFKINHRLIGETISIKNSSSLNECLTCCGFEFNTCHAITFDELTKYCYFYKFDSITNFHEEMNYISVYLNSKSKYFKFNRKLIRSRGFVFFPDYSLDHILNFRKYDGQLRSELNNYFSIYENISIEECLKNCDNENTVWCSMITFDRRSNTCYTYITESSSFVFNEIYISYIRNSAKSSICVGFLLFYILLILFILIKN